MRKLFAAGSGLLAWPRRCVHPTVIGVIATALVACGGPDGSGSPVDESAVTAGSPAPVTAGATAVSGSSVPAPAGLARIGGLDLEAATYEVADVLDAEGGAELGAMLETLDLEPDEVSFVAAVDPGGRLAIGHWELPGRDAGAIMEAWEAVAPAGWRSATLGGESILSGRSADGSLAWALARDGVFLYVVTDDERLVEAAAAAVP